MSNSQEIIQSQTATKLRKLGDIIEYLSPEDFFEAVEVFWNLSILEYGDDLIKANQLALAYQKAMIKLSSQPLNQIEAFHHHFYRLPKYCNKKPDMNFINVYQMGFKDYSEYQELEDFSDTEYESDSPDEERIPLLSDRDYIHQQIIKRRNMIDIPYKYINDEVL